MKKYYKSEDIYEYRKLLDGTTTIDLKYCTGDAIEITKEEFNIAKANNVFDEYESLNYGVYIVEQYQALVLDEEDKIINLEVVYVRQ